MNTPPLVYQACIKYTTGGVINVSLCVYCIYDCQFHPHYFPGTRNIGSGEIIAYPGSFFLRRRLSSFPWEICYKGEICNYLIFYITCSASKVFFRRTSKVSALIMVSNLPYHTLWYSVIPINVRTHGLITMRPFLPYAKKPLRNEAVCCL